MQVSRCCCAQEVNIIEGNSYRIVPVEFCQFPNTCSGSNYALMSGGATAPGEAIGDPATFNSRGFALRIDGVPTGNVVNMEADIFGWHSAIGGGDLPMDFQIFGIIPGTFSIDHQPFNDTDLTASLGTINEAAEAWPSTGIAAVPRTFTTPNIAAAFNAVRSNVGYVVGDPVYIMLRAENVTTPFNGRSREVGTFYDTDGLGTLTFAQVRYTQ